MFLKPLVPSETEKAEGRDLRWETQQNLRNKNATAAFNTAFFEFWEHSVEIACYIQSLSYSTTSKNLIWHFPKWQPSQLWTEVWRERVTPWCPVATLVIQGTGATTSTLSTQVLQWVSVQQPRKICLIYCKYKQKPKDTLKIVQDRWNQTRSSAWASVINASRFMSAARTWPHGCTGSNSNRHRLSGPTS